MAAKLFVGNLSFQATEEDLRELFAQAGTVETVRIITDQFTGRPRGFGFVEMATKEEATKAVEMRSEEHTSELQSQSNLVCRLLLEKKKKKNTVYTHVDTQDIEPRLPMYQKLNKKHTVFDCVVSLVITKSKTVPLIHDERSLVKYH